MKMSGLFIGRPVYWALAAAVILVLAGLGLHQAHVRDFVPFLFAVLAIAAAAVAAVLYLYRPGERATRETLDPDQAG
ncbi:MAG: hypothetical protein COW30_08850 [Rhodospirillales bacterium CG15_BIG_FIL_POST_REV_8_21_14_020_66_15]|nr:MAG: hypothetical protein COW30_08850 [Rhodospirillales bacterium CG15_BIG_FIL_POST_REV_8_21_14_020_66_15]